MKRIKLKYKDKYSNGKWLYNESIMSSLADCIEFFGLGVDCDYEILEVEDVNYDN